MQVAGCVRGGHSVPKLILFGAPLFLESLQAWKASCLVSSQPQSNLQDLIPYVEHPKWPGVCTYNFPASQSGLALGPNDD